MTREEALEYVNNMWMYEDTKNALETLIPEFGKAGKVIDHEDKYKEALLEARALLEPCLKYSKGKVREALDSIDKELKSFESDDERIRKELKEAFEAYDIESKWNGIPIRSIFAWLEKQKEQKPEWSEEDKRKLNRIYEILGQAADEKPFGSSKRIIGDKEAVELQDFIKLLRPSWKPSEEQMKAFEDVMTYIPEFYKPKSNLASLLRDLKKL